MEFLGPIDIVVMVGYGCVLLGLAFYFKKKASSSMEDYFLGGRKVPWWILGVSGMGNWLDVTGTSLIVSFLFMMGPRGLYIEFRGAVGLIMIFMLLWTGKWHRRSQCITNAEWMVYRFGEGLWGQLARISQAITVVVISVGMFAFMVKGVGLFYSTFLPFSPLVCSIAVITFVTVYTLMSGFYGVVYTDLLQAGVILIAVIGVVVIATAQINSYQGDVTELFAQVTGNSQWHLSSPAWKIETPKGYEPYQYLGMFALFYLLNNVIRGIGAGNDPKYFGARSDRECGLLSLLWTVLMTFRWPMAIGFAVLGIFLVAQSFPDQAVLAQAADLIKTQLGDIDPARWEDTLSTIANNPQAQPQALINGLSDLLGSDWADKLMLVSVHGTVLSERILAVTILNVIPMGFRGLILVALIAASMSTFDSGLNNCLGYCVRDLYQRYLRPQASNRELIRASYVSGVLIVVSAYLLAYSSSSLNDIWEWVVMGLGGGMIVPVMLRFYWWRFNGGGFAIGSLVGMFGALVLRFIQVTYFPDMDSRLQFCILLVLGLVASIVGTYLTLPTDEKVLAHFYKTTRPFGFWPSRFRQLLSPRQRRIMQREHRCDLSAVPFVFLFQVTLYLMPMQLLIRQFRAFGVTLAIFMVGLIGMYVLWYRELPPAQSVEEPESGAGGTRA